MTAYTFQLDLRVQDVPTLYAAAMRYALEHDKLSAKEARELLGTKRKPRIDACIGMLLDPSTLPGCKIDGHSVERGFD